LGKKVEQEVHQKITQAAKKRTEAAISIGAIVAGFDSAYATGLESLSSPRISTVMASQIHQRFDANYHDQRVREIERRIREVPHTSVGELCQRIFLPGIFKRIHADDSRHGSPYFTGASLYWVEPQPKGTLSPVTSRFEEVMLEQGTILVQAFGQEGGLPGRPTWVGRHLHKATTTHMLVRLNTHEPAMAGYLFGFLSSEAGYRQVVSRLYGGSIPHFDEVGISSVLVPLPSRDDALALSRRVLIALDARDDALSLELEGRLRVEQAIEAGGA
jgi:type I restriction enzyme S subunit